MGCIGPVQGLYRAQEGSPALYRACTGPVQGYMGCIGPVQGLYRAHIPVYRPCTGLRTRYRPCTGPIYPYTGLPSPYTGLRTRIQPIYPYIRVYGLYTGLRTRIQGPEPLFWAIFGSKGPYLLRQEGRYGLRTLYRASWARGWGSRTPGPGLWRAPQPCTGPIYPYTGPVQGSPALYTAHIALYRAIWAV